MRLGLAGGEDADGSIANAELYVPAAGRRVVQLGARENAVGAPLPNGDVLIAGGLDPLGAALATAELYDPVTGTFTPTGPLGTARSSASAAALPDGQVLVTGGNDSNGVQLSGSELYDPDTGSFSPGPSLPAAAYGSSAAPLPNGSVLIAAGANSGGTILNTAALYVPAAEASLTGGGFGSQVVGRDAGTRTVVVTNRGAQSLTITGAALGGGSASDFTIADDACVGRTLAFKQTCPISVDFTPSVSGAESMTLTLADNEPTPGSVVLTGTGVPTSVGPPGQPGNAGPQGATGGTGPAGPAGPSGPTGHAGAPRPSGGNAAHMALSLKKAKATRRAREVRVSYVLDQAVSVTLSVVAPRKRPIAVTVKKGKAGLDTITWNRKLNGKKAGKGRYTLTLTAIQRGRMVSKKVTVTL